MQLLNKGKCATTNPKRYEFTCIYIYITGNSSLIISSYIEQQQYLSQWRIRVFYCLVLATALTKHTIILFYKLQCIYLKDYCGVSKILKIYGDIFFSGGEPKVLTFHLKIILGIWFEKYVYDIFVCVLCHRISNKDLQSMKQT